MFNCNTFIATMIERSNDKKINFGHWVDDALCGPWQLMQ